MPAALHGLLLRSRYEEFAHAGGVRWRVRKSETRCLLLGQLHRQDMPLGTGKLQLLGHGVQPKGRRCRMGKAIPFASVHGVVLGELGPERQVILQVLLAQDAKNQRASLVISVSVVLALHCLQVAHCRQELARKMS
jgi:hypothetical protein